MIDGISRDLCGARRVFKRRIMNERQVAQNILLHTSTKVSRRMIILCFCIEVGGRHQFSPLDNFPDKLLKQTSRRLDSSFFRRLAGLPFFASKRRRRNNRDQRYINIVTSVECDSTPGKIYSARRKHAPNCRDPTSFINPTRMQGPSFLGNSPASLVLVFIRADLPFGDRASPRPSVR